MKNGELRNANDKLTHTKKIRKQEGITLVALVITIIVLLILAGVTLNMVMGDSGIFTKANSAKNKTEVAQYEEELRMCILELQTESATDGTIFNFDTIKEKMVKKIEELQNTSDVEFPIEESESRLDGIYKGYEFYIDDKYVAHIGDKAKGISLTTSLNPNGWTKGPVTATITIKSNNGLKKIVPQGENEINLNGDKEYKITKENITENTTYTYEVTDSQGTTQIKIAEVNTIDKNAPEEFTISAENTEEGLKITGTTTDTESGIDKYEYFVKSSTESNYTIYTENPIKNLAIEKYNVYAVAYDKAGNSRKSNEVSIQVTSPEYVKKILEYPMVTANGVCNVKYLSENDESKSFYRYEYDMGSTTATDSLPIKGYDGNNSTGAGPYNTTYKYVDVDPSAWGKTINFLSSEYMEVGYYKSSTRVKWDGGRSSSVKSYKIESGTTRLFWYINERGRMWELSVSD